MENKQEDTVNRHDPHARDPEFYSNDPYQHGTSDYGRPSEGTNIETTNSVSGMDQSVENTELVREMRENNKFNAEREAGPDNYGGTQEWDVDPNAIQQSREDAAREPVSTESGLPSSVEGLPDNPSDEALFVRKDATYLEEGDDPQRDGYDPHHVGYDDKDKT